MSIRRWMLAVLALVAALALWAAATGWPGRALLAIRILDELRRPGPESLLRGATAPPVRHATLLEADGMRIEADVYRPRAGVPGATVLMVPGAVERGRNDPRVAPFAELLARAGFRVVVPDLPSLLALRVHPDNERELAAALAAVIADRSLAPRGKAGMFGISYAGGVAVLVAADPRFAARVPFVVTVGAHADLDSVIRFLATGETWHRGRAVRLRADPYGQMVFVRTYAEFLDADDRAMLEAMVERRAADLSAPLGDLAARLSPEGRVIHDLFEGAAPPRVPGLMARFAPGMKRRAESMSPARRDLGALRARLYVVHDRDDPTIPFTEAHRLAAHARTHTRVRTVVLESLHHVEPEPWSRDPWRFVTRDVPEAWRMFAFWTAVLAEQG